MIHPNLHKMGHIPENSLYGYNWCRAYYREIVKTLEIVFQLRYCQNLINSHLMKTEYLKIHLRIFFYSITQEEEKEHLVHFKQLVIKKETFL